MHKLRLLNFQWELIYFYPMALACYLIEDRNHLFTDRLTLSIMEVKIRLVIFFNINYSVQCLCVIGISSYALFISEYYNKSLVHNLFYFYDTRCLFYDLLSLV